MEIIDYEEQYHRQVADLFTETIRSVNPVDYTDEEIEAWAPLPVDYDRWKHRLAMKRPMLALEGDKVIGFLELEANGHIDCFYVHKDWQQQGVARRLMDVALDHARSGEIPRLYAEVSITAKPFFEAMGFHSLRPNLVRKGNLTLKNYVMELLL